MEKKLSERKKAILNAVINTYFESASPVSSNEIKDKYMLDISPATIRSELNYLEEMGYLVKPHTSAGRVPSSDAYKYYVCNLLGDNPLSNEEKKLIQSYFDNKLTEIDDIIKKTAKVISDITNYTSVIVLKNIKEVKIRSIKLVEIGEDFALVIIVTDSGVISDKKIKIQKSLKDNYLIAANNILNKIFSGRQIKELINIDDTIQKEIGEYRQIFNDILNIILNFSNEKEDNVYVEGAEKILKHPEYNDIEETKNFLQIIGQKDKLHSIISDDNDIEFSLKIGKDDIGGYDHCAIVTASYSIKGKEIGKAGVIGPERMNYNKVKAVLNYIANILNNVLDDNTDKGAK